MLDIKVGIVRIDYEESVRNLAGKIIAKLAANPSKGRIVRTLEALGEDAPAVINQLLYYISNEDKTQIAAELGNRYREKIQAVVRQALDAHPVGKYLSVGNVSFHAKGEGIILHLNNIEVSYRELIDRKAQSMTGIASRLVKAAKIIPEEEVEKTILVYLDTAENRKKLIDFLEKFLREKGLALKFGQIRIRSVAVQGETVTDEPLPNQEGPMFSPESEEKIMAALTQYLRASVHKNEK